MHFNHLLCSLGGCLLTAACTPFADIKGEIAVSCILTQDQVQVLYLSTTNTASESASIDLRNATVLLYDETSSEKVGLFSFDSEDRWTLDYSAIPNRTYKLVIDIPGRKTLSAYTTMPDTIEPEFFKGMPYYTDDKLPSDAVWMTGMDFDPKRNDYFIVEKIATNICEVDDFNTTGEFYHHKDFFPSEEVIVFYYVENKPLHRQFIRIPPVKEGGKREADGHPSIKGGHPISISGSFSDHYSYGYPLPSYVLLMAVSEEYDQYLKSILSKNIEDFGDIALSPVLNHSSYPSNIENGTGVFGGKTEQKQYWSNMILY